MQYLASPRIAQAESMIARLKACPYLESASLGRQLDQVNGVSMPEFRGVESLSVIVYNHLSVDDFVLPVEVNVRDAQIVVALARIPCGLPRLLPAIKLPAA